jgi:hypothetical protein
MRQTAISLQTDALTISFDSTNGCIREIVDKGTQRVICTGSLENTLWRVFFRDREQTRSSEFSANSPFMQFHHHVDGNRLTFNYESNELKVSVEFRADGSHVDARLSLVSSSRTVLTQNFPFKLSFNLEALNRFHYPEDLGLAFKKGFYEDGHNSKSLHMWHYMTRAGATYNTGGWYPDLFCDFVFLDSEDGTLAVYGIQSQDDVFVPCTLGTTADPGNRRTPYYDHAFNAYIRPGEQWTSPTVRMEVGATLRDAARSYSQANGYHRTLRDKLKPELLEKFRKSILLHLRAKKGVKRQYTFREELTSLAKFAEFAPLQLHISDFMHGGFDKEYPDLLPPNPRKGTFAELKELYDRAHALGMLVAPYTNPTWYCDAPPSPTLTANGDSAIARDLDGEPIREFYVGNEGWALTASHPTAQKFHRRDVERFTQELPSDILLQDQVGSRQWLWDTNPAAGVPHAYIQNLINVAKEDSHLVPVSTEDGFDRLIDHEVQFCGLTWRLDPDSGRSDIRSYASVYKDAQNDSTYRCSGRKWEVSPFALYFAHDKVAFTHHDLSQTIDTKAQLSFSLALGYMMIYRRGPDITEPELCWMRWLNVIQKHVCARYLEKRLESFEFLRPDVTRSIFEDMTVVAVWSAAEYEVRAGTVITGDGFHVESADGQLVAGTYSMLDGQDYGPESYYLRDGLDVWVSPAGGSPIHTTHEVQR